MPPGYRSAPRGSRRAVLHGVVVDLLNVGVGWLVRAVDPDQALLVERRTGLGVAAVPARADAALLERPVDRAAQPRLLGKDVQVVLDEVLLEPVRALLLGRAVAVCLGAELRHDDRLVRVAGVDAVEEGREQVLVGHLAARSGIPAEVLVDADDLQAVVGALAPGLRVADDGEADRAGRVEAA